MFQQLAYGILSGFQYSIIALGISLVFGVMRYLNLAHGSLIILGCYGYLFLYRAGVDPFVSIPLVMLGMFVLGGILFKVLYTRLVGLQEGARVQKSLLISFGLMLVIDNFSTLVWTSDERSISPSYSGASFEVLGIHVPFIGLAGGALAILIILGLHLLFTRTMFGKSVGGGQPGSRSRGFERGERRQDVYGFLRTERRPGGHPVRPDRPAKLFSRGGHPLVQQRHRRGPARRPGQPVRRVSGGHFSRAYRGRQCFLLWRALPGNRRADGLHTGFDPVPQGFVRKNRGVMSEKSKVSIFILFIAVLAAVPLVIKSDYIVNLSVMLFIYIIAAESWNLLGGYTGQISLGHAAFFGMGAIIARVLWVNHVPFIFALLGGGVASSILSVLVGTPCLRIRMAYFPIGTLALSMIAQIAVGNLFPMPGGLSKDLLDSYNVVSRYYVALAVVVICMGSIYLIVRSKTGHGHGGGARQRDRRGLDRHPDPEI